MTLLHPHHHHHHLDPLFNRTIPPLPPPPVQLAPGVGAFVLHGQTETTPHFIVAPAPIVDDTQARIDNIELRIRSLHVFDRVLG